MPLQGTSGAASQDAFGGSGVAVVPNYVEDVFSTYLYTGNATDRSITNGIDLSTKGGMLWIKDRDNAIRHALFDSARGSVSYFLISNSTASENTGFTDNVTSFDISGFSLGTGNENASGRNYVSWTFRKQPKFFDVVTYTGTGANRTIAHNLGAVPGCIIVKRLDTAEDWAVYHRSLANTQHLVLNDTAAADTGATWWNSTTPTSSVFSVGTNASVNASGGTYVAYLFAHDAGGFGLAGTDNVISCGSYTGNGAASNPITLGYEPQWILLKRTDITGDWGIIDTMRGWSYSTEGVLKPNTSGAEDLGNNEGNPTATGFDIGNGNYNINTRNYIYIAIRRGPMKVPTLGTSVFSPIASSASTGTIQTTGFPVDMQIAAYRPGDSENSTVNDRLRGVSSTAVDKIVTLKTSATTAQSTVNGIQSYNWGNTGFGIPSYLGGSSGIYWNFRRAPSFFDEVCYTGDGIGTSQTHNLGVIPELKIIKSRSAAFWVVGGSIITGVGARANNAVLNTDAAVVVNASYWDVADTSTTFSVRGNNSASDISGTTYVAYLFATCPGVSKVGSYTGTATTKQIDCGFTAGARFVLIKRTDSTGDWYVWDSARGIVSGNDSYLLLNSTAAEVTSTDYIDTYSAGFEISSTAPAAINANGGSFIFLAIS